MSLARVQVFTEADVLYLDALPTRVAIMVRALVQHQTIICAYEQGSVSLHFNGPDVRPQLEKVSLNTQKPLNG